jgi:hypothetical protein
VRYSASAPALYVSRILNRRAFSSPPGDMDVFGEQIVSPFLTFGDAGMLVALVCLVLIDGAGLPTVPEMWLLLFFGAHPETFAWGATVAVVASVAGLGGIMIQYSLARLARLPKRLTRVMKRYTDFLVLHDERLLLLNKAAPMIPYSGAFVAALGWDLKKSLTYSLVGSLGKAFMVVTIAFFAYGGLAQEIAGWVSFALVGSVLGASMVFSVVLKKKYGFESNAKNESPAI